MAFYNNVIAGAAGSGGADAGYKIERSLRFNKADSAYLSQTFSSGNRKTWTWSGWVKRSQIGGSGSASQSFIFGASNGFQIYFSVDKIYLDSTASVHASDYWTIVTDRVLRDPSAWYHLVFVHDTTETSADDRFKIYVNGVQITSFSSNNRTNLSQDYEGGVNANNSEHRIGRQPGLSVYANFYLAEVHFLDGLTPGTSTDDASGSVTGTPNAEYLTDFGEFDADTGVWNPIEYTGSYGPTPVSYSDNSQTDLPDGNVYLSTQPVENIFDGNDSTYARINRGTNTETNATFKWEPTGGYTGVTKIRIKYDYCTSYRINGGAWANVNNNGGYQEIFNGASFTLNTLEIRRTNASGSDFGIFVYAIEINDTLVSNIDNNGFHLDFSDNSSDAALGTDSSGNSNTWTVNNLTAENPTTLPGVAFDGNGDYLSIADSSDFTLGTNDFTMEGYFYASAYNNYARPFGQATEGGSSTNNAIGCFFDVSGNGNTLYVRYGTDPSGDKETDIVVNNFNGGKNNWFHLAIVRDGADLKIFKNGTLLHTENIGASYSIYDSSANFNIGASSNPGEYWTGYISNVRFVNGTALYTSNFTLPTTPLSNVTNTVLLCCQSSSSATAATVSPGTITANGDVYAGEFNDSTSANDSLIDSPTNYAAISGNNGGNYATFNPLHVGNSSNSGVANSASLSDGNLRSDGASGKWGAAISTMPVPSSGKWYFEFTCLGTNSNFGLFKPVYALDGTIRTSTDSKAVWYGFDGIVYHYVSSTVTDSSTPATYTTNDVIGIAVDSDAYTVKYYKNNSLQYTQTLVSALQTELDAGNLFPGADTYSGVDAIVNFGQRPFAYTPPTGHVSLCTQNLPDPTITNGSTAFNVITATGTAADRTFTMPGGFGPDLVWAKQRDSASNNALFDTLRGATKRLVSNSGQVEDTQANQLKSFTSTGFTYGSDIPNNSSQTGVYWAWDAGTVGTNDVGDYWSPPTYKTKYIGFKFPTSSGGRAVFGLIAGTGTADIYTSSDNNSWTRVQQNVTLSTTDTTYDSTSQYLLVVNTTDAVWDNRHYAMATSGTDAHYSTQTYPGSGASFTWSGPAYTDWDFRSSGTVIKPGSLNSSLYDQSQTWSNLWTGTAQYGSFANLHDADDTDYAQSTSATLTFPSAIALTSLQIRHSTSFGTATLSINGTDVTSQLPTTGTKPLTTITGFTSLTSISVSGDDYVSNVLTLYEIFVNGKKLVDNGVSVTNVPSIASTVRANQAAGFSIVSWPGTANATVAHGLGKKPELVITKSRTNAVAWRIWSSQFTNTSSGYLGFDTNGESTFGGTYWGTMDSNILGMGAGTYDNNNGDMIAYCFTNVDSYLQHGKYVGNGNADGPFVSLNFEPALIALKRIDGSGNDWCIYDTQRSPYNAMDDKLKWNSNGAELTEQPIDFLSNGFKPRNTAAGFNGSGNTYIYLAIARSAFKIARAR